MDGVGNDTADRILTKALGEELRRVRADVGWSRSRLIAEMDSDIHVQTLATYEQGARQCTVVRLVEICRALGVSAPAVLGLALQRAEIDLRMIGLQVDLKAAVRDKNPEVQTISQWAARRLAADESETVVYLERSVIHEMSMCFGHSEDQLVRLLRRYTPDRAPRQ